MLRTRAPVVSGKASFSLLPLDLHVLGLPLAFILSQDQTLHCKKFNLLRISGNLTSDPLLNQIPLPGGEVDFLWNPSEERFRAAASSQRTYLESARGLLQLLRLIKVDDKCNRF